MLLNSTNQLLYHAHHLIKFLELNIQEFHKAYKFFSHLNNLKKKNYKPPIPSFDNPKSVILICPSLSIIIFSGFKSL